MKITFVALLAIVFLAAMLAPIFRLPRKRVFGGAAIFAVLAFIPSCSLIMRMVDSYRFGVFSYADFQELADFRVQRHLPPSARDITIEKYAQGFRAKYKIDKQALQEWLNGVWDRDSRSGADPARKEPRPLLANQLVELVREQLGHLRWPALAEATEYQGPRAANGGGFTIWYSERQSTAYQETGFW